MVLAQPMKLTVLLPLLVTVTVGPGGSDGLPPFNWDTVNTYV